LLYPIGIGPLRPPGFTHRNLIDVARHIWLHLPNIEPLQSLILHICVQWDGDILTCHPISKMQISVIANARSGSPRTLRQKSGGIGRNREAFLDTTRRN
jgi:hypothetical protein